MIPLKRVGQYDSRDLGYQQHIAVLGSCKVGNFVATLPLLRLVRRRYPNAQIDFGAQKPHAILKSPCAAKSSRSIGASHGTDQKTKPIPWDDWKQSRHQKHKENVMQVPLIW